MAPIRSSARMDRNMMKQNMYIPEQPDRVARTGDLTQGQRKKRGWCCVERRKLKLQCRQIVVLSTPPPNGKCTRKHTTNAVPKTIGFWRIFPSRSHYGEVAAAHTVSQGTLGKHVSCSSLQEQMLYDRTTTAIAEYCSDGNKMTFGVHTVNSMLSVPKLQQLSTPYHIVSTIVSSITLVECPAHFLNKVSILLFFSLFGRSLLWPLFKSNIIQNRPRNNR